MSDEKKICAWFQARWGRSQEERGPASSRTDGRSEPVFGFGALALVALLLVALSGLYMAMFYQASPAEAWKSIVFLEGKVRFGHFARSLHRWAAFIAMLLAILHLVGVIYRGAYRSAGAPNWLVGLILLILTVGFVVTGYMLPWNFKAYWIVKTLTNWLASLPLCSGLLNWLLYTDAPNGLVPVGRWFAIHITVLPVLFGGFFSAHYLLFRRANAPNRGFGARRMAVKRFSAVLGTVLLVAGLAAFGTIKQDVADPITTSNLPQPDWLLQMFFQVTRYCQDGAEMLGVFWLPLGILLLLALLPWIDRAAKGGNAVKWTALCLSLAIFIAWGVVTHHTGSTTPIDSCAACHKAGFGEGFAHAPVMAGDFSDRYDNKWLSLHYRYPQYFWMMDADVPKW